MIEYLIIAVVSYFLGSLNFAFFVGRLKGIDFSKVGTHNYGTTNVFRATHSPLLALLTLVWDAGKGILSVIISSAIVYYTGGNTEFAMLTAAFFSILGHDHSFLLRFRRSGRGVATYLGLSTMIEPLTGIIWLLSWVPGYVITGIISAGQLTAIFFTPALAWLAWKAGFISQTGFIFALVGNLLMFEAHFQKLKAIRTGKEPRNYLDTRKKKSVDY